MRHVDYITTYDLGFFVPFTYLVTMLLIGFVLIIASDKKPLRKVAIQAWFKKNLVHCVGLWLTVLTIGYCLSAKGFTTFCFTVAAANIFFAAACVLLVRSRNKRS